MKRVFLTILALLFSAIACTTALPDLATQEQPTAVHFLPLMPTGTHVAVAQNTCLVVTATESLHLREAPSEHSQALDWLPSGMIIAGLDEQGGWWLVDAEGSQGYVKAEFVEACEKQVLIFLRQKAKHGADPTER